MLDSEIAKTIPLAKRIYAGPREGCVREKCYEAHGSIHIKWMNSCFERVLADGRGVANALVESSRPLFVFR
jgi:hypothetical protein